MVPVGYIGQCNVAAVAPKEMVVFYDVVLVLQGRAVLRLVLETQSGPRATRHGAFKERICANDRSLRRQPVALQPWDSD